MKIAIMQPYFLPYIGYFQLINAVDLFLIYDNIKYTKKGWINRNRFLLNGRHALFSVPLKKDSDSLDIRDRRLSDSFDKTKLLNQLAAAYAGAPHFARAFNGVGQIASCDETNLFRYVLNSVERVCSYIGIRTEIVASSEVPIDHRHLRAQDKVIALCKTMHATQYINPIGGVQLYDKALFKQHGIELSFLRSGDVKYVQFDHEFVANLSIVDVMMFNSAEQIRAFLPLYSLT